MIYFKQFVFFVVFYLFNFNIGFAQFTKLPDYNWNKFNIVKLDTIEVSDEFKELPIFILYNYHKESFASPDKPYTKLYKAIQIQSKQGIAEFEKDRFMIGTFDRVVSYGMRITSKNGEYREIHKKDLEREYSYKIKPKSDIRFTGYSSYDFTSELFYPKPLIEVGDLVEVYCKLRPYSERLSGKLKVNELFPINIGAIEVMTAKSEKPGTRELMVPTNDIVLSYAIKPNLMISEQFYENNKYAFQTFHYRNIKVNDNINKAIPTLCFPNVVYAVIKVTSFIDFEPINTLGWDNLITVVSKNLDPFRTMKKDWNYFYLAIDSIKDANRQESNIILFEEVEKYITTNIKITELKGDFNYYSPGYYFKTKEINNSSVLRAYSAALHRLEIPYYIGVGRRKHDGPLPFESYLFLDQYFLAIPNGDSYAIYFEPTESDYHCKNEIPIELLGMKVIIFKPFGKVKDILTIDLPQNPMAINKRLTKIDIRTNDGNMNIVAEQKFTNSMSTQYRFDLIRDYQKSNWKALGNQLSSFDWLSLDSVNLSVAEPYQKFVVDYTYDLSVDSFQLYDLLPTNLLPEVSPKERLYNYYGDFAKKEMMVIMIHLQEGENILNLENFNQSFENEAGKARVIASGFGQLVNFQILIDLKEYNYSPEDYSELRDFVIKAQSILKVPIHIGS
jgi:hypothetical protein